MAINQLLTKAKPSVPGSRIRGALAIALIAGCTLAAPAMAVPPPEPVHPPCRGFEQIASRETYVNVMATLEACVVEGKLDAAAGLYGLAGSLGAFDRMRVADPSAHQVLQVAPMILFERLGPERQAAFTQHVQTSFGDDATRGRLCAQLVWRGPPDYAPDYMIRHGMAAMNDPQAPPYVSGFDARAAWPHAVQIYLQCPKG